MNQPTLTLRQEHQVILAVLDCFEAALRGARDRGAVTALEFGPFVEFFRDFADRCHHCKEEDRLFPCLERCGMPREHGPIAVMLHEHEVGRAHVRAMAESLPAADGGDRAAIESVLLRGAAFIDLLRNHILKENHVLFQMADGMIPASERAALAEDFNRADGSEENRRSLAQCRTIAADLCARYGVAPPQNGPMP